MDSVVLDTKWEQLTGLLDSLQSAVVAFSGGVDSSLLAKAAYDVLGTRSVAVTGVSETVKTDELSAAQSIARHIGIRHLTVDTREMDNPAFVKNDSNRCYYCKSELFSVLQRVAREQGFAHVVEGSNYDDCSDFRPGLKASQELNIIRPLIEARLTKAEIREKAKILGLPNWNKPASPCLSSRFPYGQSISPKQLAMVEQGERLLKQKGFLVFRLRHHHNLARIEIPPEDFPRLMSQADEIVSRLRAIGYVFVTLDLQGFRSGSLNEVLTTQAT